MKPCLGLIIVVLICSRVCASDLPFLESGKDYVIHFQDAANVFKMSQSGISPTYMKKPDGTKEPGEPATWTMKAVIEVFHVLEPGAGSWVKMELPANPEDYTKWNAKRKSIAILTDQNIAELSGTDEGKARLEKLRESAGYEIETAVGWVNLDKAAAIHVPTTLTPKKAIVSAKIN